MYPGVSTAALFLLFFFRELLSFDVRNNYNNDTNYNASLPAVISESFSRCHGLRYSSTVPQPSGCQADWWQVMKISVAVKPQEKCNNVENLFHYVIREAVSLLPFACSCLLNKTRTGRLMKNQELKWSTKIENNCLWSKQYSLMLYSESFNSNTPPWAQCVALRFSVMVLSMDAHLGTSTEECKAYTLECTGEGNDHVGVGPEIRSLYRWSCIKLLGCIDYDCCCCGRSVFNIRLHRCRWGAP